MLILQKKIIEYLWNEIKEEESVLQYHYGVTRIDRRDFSRQRFNISLVSKYWWGIVSRLFSYCGIVSVTKNNQHTKTIYDLLFEKINNPHNLLSFHSQLSFLSSIQLFKTTQQEINLQATNTLYHQLNGELNRECDNNDGDRDLDGIDIAQRNEFYKRFYINIRRLSINIGSLTNFDLEILYQGIKDISACEPDLDSFNFSCDVNFILDLPAEVSQALCALGITYFHFTFTAKRLMPHDMDKLKQFFVLHAPSITSFNIQAFKDDNLQVCCQLLPMLTNLKNLYYSSFYGDDVDEDQQPFYQIVSNLKLDKVAIDFFSPEQNEQLFVKNQISTYRNSPLSIVSLTKGKEFSIKLADPLIQSPIVYSKSIKSININHNSHTFNIDDQDTGAGNSIQKTCFVMDSLMSGKHTLDFLFLSTPINIDYLAGFVHSNPAIRNLAIGYIFSGNQMFYQSLVNNVSLFSIELTIVDQNEIHSIVNSVAKNTTLKYVIITSIPSNTFLNDTNRNQIESRFTVQYKDNTNNNISINNNNNNNTITFILKDKNYFKLI
ncbi:hypothetical protein CYY_003903 [Polysphondylium violaceum]|uniref:Uncharacterized protein n=1 Tax=Polysphondylium violaceum TaxID=133409 RepID=A0A8J4PW36_9MYCE|nr:hypothetical protein CYY_003903 [Polysphondylium violaceum]